MMADRGSKFIIPLNHEVARGYRVCPIRKDVRMYVRTYVHHLSSF